MCLQYFLGGKKKRKKIIKNILQLNSYVALNTVPMIPVEIKNYF